MAPCAQVEQRCAAPRDLLATGSAPTGHLLQSWPPPLLAAGAKVSLGSTPAARSLLTARWLQLQTRREIRRGLPYTEHTGTQD